MKKQAIILCLVITAYTFAYAGIESIPINRLPDGTAYISNQIIIVNEHEAPSYQTNNTISGYAATGVGSIDQLCQALKVIKAEPFYQGILREPALIREISRMYIFTLHDETELFSALELFENNPNIEFAELYTLPELYYTPDDPYFGQQWHLTHIHAPEAWDVIRGDAARHSIIGIVDIGVNWHHPDLADNIWVNDGEDLNHNGVVDPDDYNNIDDDDNGFIDDIIGWDFGENDCDPDEGYVPHGTGVAGCASEVTDNSVGGAGIGFSARLMCVKASNEHGWLINPYQAMIYAAENGAQIINASWGSYLYIESHQAIINALWAMDVLIIAAEGGEYPDCSYPAGYENVMSVTVTDQNDHKAYFANYGEWIDICAPGVDILMPWDDDYCFASGTSFATSLVSGLAALLRAYYPGNTNDEIQQIIENSADSIDHLNPGYEGLLGAGRINAGNCFPTGIDEHQVKPLEFKLSQNYPNPFNPSTTIEYTLPKAADVSLCVYNIIGQNIETLVNEKQSAGYYKIVWNADDKPSGIYFYKLQMGNSAESKRMILLK